MHPGQCFNFVTPYISPDTQISREKHGVCYDLLVKKLIVIFLLAFISSGCAASRQGLTPSITPEQATPDPALAQATTAASETLEPAQTLPPTPTSQPTPTPIALTDTPQPILTATLPPSSTPTSAPTPTPTVTLSPEEWQMMPVIPGSLSQKMCQVYTLGQMLGNNPRAFSKVGDCQTMLPNFLGYFDEGKYNLGEYTHLQAVLDYFTGSFGRTSRAAKDGLSAGGALATLWNDWKDCDVMETPLDCEYRINRPSFAFISVGTNDVYGYAPFETTLRRVIDNTIGHGVVPILVTKADNAEGDHSYNTTMARLALEYELPLWNFWLAIQPLPEHGMRSPEHLTYGDFTNPADFSLPENMQYAFNVRNLNALQVLEVVMNSCGIATPTATP